MSNKFKTAKDGFVDALSPKKDLMNLFLWLVGASAVIFCVLSLALGNGANASVFFRRGGDFFMDCFNQIRDCAQGKEVYSERHVIYPPMANLIFLILSRFTDAGYNDTSFDDRLTWKEYGPSFILLMLVFAVCFLVTFALILKATKRESLNRRLIFAAMATLSLPLLYTLERGNILILCVISLLIYAFSYHSDSKVAREIGLLALAFSFSIKLYPVVFGWILIADKRYKEAIRCAIYGVLMLILPSFFFGGPIFCVKSVYENITSWSTGSGNDIVRAMEALQLGEGWQSAINVLIYLWILISAVCFAVSPFFRPNKPWKTWALGVTTILCVPSLMGLYAWAFMLIPLIMMFNKEKATGKNIAYVVLMTLPFMYLPLNLIPIDALLAKIVPSVSAPNVPVSTFWLYLITAVMSVFVVVDTLIDLGTFFSERKARKQAVETN